MDYGLKGHVAIVTGSTSGIGLALAGALAAEGVNLVINGLGDPAAIEAERASLAAKHGVEVRYHGADMTKGDQIADMVAFAEKEFGRLDILVNNAGILPEATATDAVDPLDLDLFRRTFRTNLLGAVAVTAAVLPLLVESDRGRVVNVSSRMGSLSDQLDPASPYHSVVVPAYQASKAALNGLTIALAKKLAGTPVKVNAVCPGWVQTDLGGPDNRAAAPTPADEAAEVVARAALLDETGPSGSFFDADGPVPW